MPIWDDLTSPERGSFSRWAKLRIVDRELTLLLYGLRVLLVGLVVVVVLGMAVLSLRAPNSAGVGRCTAVATGTVCSIVP